MYRVWDLITDVLQECNALRERGPNNSELFLYWNNSAGSRVKKPLGAICLDYWPDASSRAIVKQLERTYTSSV